MNKAEAMTEVIKLLEQAEQEHYSGQVEKSNQTITKLITVISDQYEQHKDTRTEGDKWLEDLFNLNNSFVLKQKGSG